MVYRRLKNLREFYSFSLIRISIRISITLYVCKDFFFSTLPPIFTNKFSERESIIPGNLKLPGK